MFRGYFCLQPSRDHGRFSHLTFSCSHSCLPRHPPTQPLLLLQTNPWRWMIITAPAIYLLHQVRYTLFFLSFFFKTTLHFLIIKPLKTASVRLAPNQRSKTLYFSFFKRDRGDLANQLVVGGKPARGRLDNLHS